jgi:hypothetical protein
MDALLSIVVMTASMLVLGWLVWTHLQRQESKDERFRRKLDDDDARAAEARGIPVEAMRLTGGSGGTSDRTTSADSDSSKVAADDGVRNGDGVGHDSASPSASNPDGVNPDGVNRGGANRDGTNRDGPDSIGG